MQIETSYLSSSQRAVIALEFERYFAVEAEKRMKAGVKVERNPGAKMHQGSKARSAEQAAKVLKTNQQYVKDAKKLEKDAPDLLEKVRSGLASINETYKKVKAEWSKWSNREIARRCGVDPETVNKARLKVEANSILGKFPSEEREIARRCGVGYDIVGRLRSALSIPILPESGSEERIYTTKHGTPSVMKTERIEMGENSILPFNGSMERTFIHHKTGEASIMNTERIGSYTVVPEAREFFFCFGVG